MWPLSREHYSKQFLTLDGGQTLLQTSLTRLSEEFFKKNSVQLSAPLIICNVEHRFLVAEQAREIGQNVLNIILEPIGKNTAPALTCAALLQDRDDPIIVMMPADHRIVDTASFHKAVLEAIALASKDYIVTLGIKPDRAATGYGYIHCGDSISGAKSTYEIDFFTEKPDAETACKYFEDGSYLWNSGIFILKASVWLEAISVCSPQILSACSDAVKNATADMEFYRLEPEAFQSCPPDSVDYAVMERLHTLDTVKGAVVCMEPQWSDIGSWNSLWEIMPKDVAGNLKRGDVCLIDARNNIVWGNKRLIAALGIENLVIVETPDAVMIAPRDRSQDVRQIVDWLKINDRNEYREHNRAYRPWGSFESLDTGDRFQVKRLTIKPGQSISLQLHHHRSEHWVIVQGVAEIIRGEEVLTLSENESVYIPKGIKHRLTNPGKNMLEVIEVQSGDYLGEDDIVRFEDKYNRN